MYKYLLYTIICCIITSSSLYAGNETPKAEKGILDLRDWCFYEDGIIQLKGEWEFYWNSLFMPGDFKNEADTNKHFILVPKNWKGELINGEKIDQFGYATYRLRILLNEKAPNEFSIAVSYIPTACKIFINGDLTSKHGIVGKSKKEYDPGFINEVIDFSSDTDTIEIIIQVANYKFYKAGLAYDINFGEISKTNRFRTTHFGLELFLIGALLIMAIFFISFYLFRPVDKGALYFGIFCLLSFTYSFFVGLPHLMLMENLSFKFQTNIIRYTSYFFPLFLFLFFKSSFPNEINKIFIWFLAYPCILLALLTVFLPIHISSPFMIIYRYFVTVALLYLCYVIILAVVRKRPGAKVLLTGFGFLFLFIMNDILYHAEIIDTSNLMSVGLLSFIASMSYYLSARFAIAFRKKEQLAKELNVLNENQEQIIQERTMKITLQKEEIKAQADQLSQTNNDLIELDKFKEGLTHMIVHDLKNPLNIICSLPEIIQTGDNIKIIKKAGDQMLNLISNILDVQKYEVTNMELNLNKLKLVEIANNAIEQTTETYGIKEIKIFNNIDKDVFVNADHDILERIFLNLLINAIKFTPQKGKIILGAIEENGYLKIMVKDTGVGISPEMKDLIFDKFVQVIAKKSGKARSTGLGLTFCRIAVEAHKGKIWAESEKDKGAVFYFTLPSN